MTFLRFFFLYFGKWVGYLEMRGNAQTFGMGFHPDRNAESYRKIEHADIIKDIMMEPAISTIVDYYDGILFENRMIIEYKGGEVEMDRSADQFFSAMGLKMFKQYLMFGMCFWYMKEDDCEELGTSVRPMVPDGNFQLRARFNKYQIEVAFFSSREEKMDKDVRFHIIDEPVEEPTNRLHSPVGRCGWSNVHLHRFTFGSKIRKLVDKYIDYKFLWRNAIDIEKYKKQPRYYYQNSHLPVAGKELNNDILDGHILYYVDDERSAYCRKSRNCNLVSSDEYWGISDTLRSLYSDNLCYNGDQPYGVMTEQRRMTNCDGGQPYGGMTEQRRMIKEKWMIAKASDDFMKQFGSPFFAHRPVITCDIINPLQKRQVMRMGPSIELRWIPIHEPNFQIISKKDDDWTNTILEIFGFQNIRTLYSTKTGAQTLLTTLNEAINHYKEVCERILSDAVQHLLGSMEKLGHKNTELLRNDMGKFLGVRVQPRPFVEDRIVEILIKEFKQNSGLVNEVLSKTSIGELKSLDRSTAVKRRRPEEADDLLPRKRRRTGQSVAEDNNTPPAEDDDVEQTTGEGGEKKN